MSKAMSAFNPEKLELSAQTFQLICAMRRIDGTAIFESHAEHFWEEVILLAEQHGLKISGGIRKLD